MGVNNRNLLSRASGDQKFKINGPADLVSCEVVLSGLHIVTFLLCPHVVSPLCSCGVKKEEESTLMSLLIRKSVGSRPHS